MVERNSSIYIKDVLCLIVLCGQVFYGLRGVKSYLIPYYNCEKNYLNLLGRIEVGGLTMICGGSLIAVADGAVLKFGEGCFINNRVKLFCENMIEFEDNVRLSWECQVFDSNFHYTSHDGVIKPKIGVIHLGKRTWVGNRVTVQKNTCLPPYSIVASNSVINKDFSANAEGGMYAGLPAKLLSTNNKRIVGEDNEFVIGLLLGDDKEQIKEAEMEMEKQNLRDSHASWKTIWGGKGNF